MSEIKQLSEREHILLRPAMYIGAVDLTKVNDYILTDGKITYSEIEYVPGLIKIINEIIDNSVDVAIKTNFQSSNIISVKMTDEYIEVQDNGTGIPIKENDGIFTPRLAWGFARAGSNFDDDANRVQIGQNGVGSFATNCFSKRFIGKSDDGERSYNIEFKNNASEYTEKLGKSTKSGVNVKFYPDLTRFGINSIDEVHQNVIRQRLINLGLSYPQITFKFNGKKLNISSFKKYVSLFSEEHELYETEDYKFAIMPNPDDDFRQFSYVNGLKIPEGGTHIDIITNKIVSPIREKLLKKYKTIKPADIKNKLMIVCFMKNLKNTKFNSQSKEKITNSQAEINDYLGDIDFDTITNKILKNKAIIDPITEVYRIKEEFKRRQELKGLKKPVKKIKSDKYYPSIGVSKYLVITEGASASGSLMPTLGRKECGFYELKGKPLNSYSAPQSKFTSNKELSELYKIIKNENYEYVVFATDQDLDGFHIRGLLIGFIQRYLPELKGNVGMLQTPVIAITKNNKLSRWHYKLNEEITLKQGDKSEYKKGLGSWDSDDLKSVVNVDGIAKMIEFIDFNTEDSEKVIEDWLGSKSEPRKKYLQNNQFSIAKL